MADLTIAIGAAPNSGKTTLFNRLTGASQAVGNWPGVTVEKKTGHFVLDGLEAELVDLPGTYSITPSTLEERIVRDYFLDSPPDVILNVVNATNLYRGLGLTLQLAMTGIPMVLAVNMMDEARKQGLEVDFEAFSRHLDMPVVPLTAKTGEGLAQLKQALVKVFREKPRFSRPPRISFPPVLEKSIAELARRIETEAGPAKLDKIFVAIRLLEGGEATTRLLQHQPGLKDLVGEAEAQRSRLERTLGEDLPLACARCRFSAARGLEREVTRRPTNLPVSLTDKLDCVLMHRFFGLPLFFAIMLLLFQGVFFLGVPLQESLAALVGTLQAWLKPQAASWGVPDFVAGLVTDGLIEGVGVVVSFTPIIGLFFVFLSLIEDTGYIARAAFLMDRVMHWLRLDGKAFISILLGYGCNVPAIMGTRILSGQHNRILTMLLIPFSLCTARLQIFLFLAALLFTTTQAAWVVFALYAGSFAAIILAGLVLKPFQLGGPPEPFVMELPPYRMPSLQVVALRSWHEIRDFLYRASTLIVAGVLLIWLLTHLPPGTMAGSGETWAGHLGRALSPLFEPLGIPWQETVALIFGFVAKEIVIGVLAVIHGNGGLAAHLTPLQGLSFMVFTLLYTPCIATLAVIRAESRSWKIALLSILLGLVFAWLGSFLVYQGGRLLGFA